MKNFPRQCIFVLVAAATMAAAPAYGDEQPAARMPAQEHPAVPRDPGEFEFGQYHGSSKMTPGGSHGPERWGRERTDVGPPTDEEGDTTSGASGQAEEDDLEQTPQTDANRPRGDRKRTESGTN